MKVIVGLGNPGKQYEKTPHNIGFRVIDALVERMYDEGGVEHVGAQRHKLYTLEEFWYARDNGERERIVLLKPQTFMNESGVAVKEYLAYHGNACDVSKDVWIIHDDGDITLGSLRLDINKRAAGHNGVQSIFDHLGTKDMIRFRFGIRPSGTVKKTGAFVLRPPQKSEMETYATGTTRMVDGILIALCDSFEQAQLFLNTKKPPS
ncbi:MAG: aminoacyl-tRNA hydrolase [Candidatus Uhrbacteria bacterium]|nr:aminoacyl-tRNA hydrolase [Candidatus Uhrbacteria bacterium]